MQRQLRKLIPERLLKFGAVLTMLATLFAVSGIPHHFFDLFSHFRLQYFAVSLLLFLVFCFLRRPPYSIALLVAFLVNAVAIVPWYLSNETEHDATKVTLKILHANVWSSNTQYQALSDFVEASEPDIVFIQEFNDGWLSGTQRLREKLPFVLTEARSGNFGIAVFSKHDFDSATTINSPPLHYPSLKIALTKNERSLTLISSHPTIPLGSLLYEARNEQLDSVTRLVQQTSGPVVLLGDFNSTMWDRRYRQLESETGLRNSRQGFGLSPSWPTYMPIAMIPIDHLMVSTEIEILEHSVGPRIGSDHLPLVVTLSF